MTDQLVNAIKRHVSAMIGQVGQTRVGIVTSVNTANYTARVMVQPEGVLSGWLPMAATMVGGGWGLVSPCSVGEQVAFLAQEGDAEHGIIVARLFSNQQQPPKIYTDQYAQGNTSYIQPGEIGLVHKDGTFLRLIGGKVLIHGDLYVDGIIQATKDISSDMNVNAKLNVNATVDVTAKRDIIDSHGSVQTLRNAYDLHKHGNSPTTDHPVA